MPSSAIPFKSLNLVLNWCITALLLVINKEPVFVEKVSILIWVSKNEVCIVLSPYRNKIVGIAHHYKQLCNESVICERRTRRI